VRNKSGASIRNFRGARMSATLTYGDVVNGFIRRRYGPLKHAAKLLARAAGTTPRTAENWLAGLHAPNGDKLVNLMAECDELAEEISRLVAERRAARGEQ
jgi:hypothetical protein